jgi:hypothetical protein
MGKRKYNKKIKKAKCECQNKLKKAVDKAQKIPPKPIINEEAIFNKKKPGKKTRKAKR